MRIRTVSSNTAYAEITDAMLKCNCSANAIEVQLNASRLYPDDITIKKVDASVNAVTVIPAAGETIDGLSSVSLTIENEKKTLVPVEDGWSVVDNINDLPAAAVTLTGAQTLTNKTLTSPNINEAVALLATSTELNSLDGSIAGTSVASKALVLGADKNTDIIALPVSGLKIGAGAGTAVDRTAAELNLLIQGVAAGYKIARGTVTPVSASDTIATGLAIVVAVIVSFKGAPSLTHMFNYGDVGNQAGAPAAGSFLLKSSKPTGAADVTPIASTTPWSAVDWIAIGT